MAREGGKRSACDLMVSAGGDFGEVGWDCFLLLVDPFSSDSLLPSCDWVMGSLAMGEFGMAVGEVGMSVGDVGVVRGVELSWLATLSNFLLSSSSSLLFLTSLPDSLPELAAGLAGL